MLYPGWRKRHRIVSSHYPSHASRIRGCSIAAKWWGGIVYFCFAKRVNSVHWGIPQVPVQIMPPIFAKRVPIWPSLQIRIVKRRELQRAEQQQRQHQELCSCRFHGFWTWFNGFGSTLRRAGDAGGGNAFDQRTRSVFCRCSVCASASTCRQI